MIKTQRYQMMGNFRLEGMKNRIRRYRQNIRKAQIYEIMGNLSYIGRDMEDNVMIQAKDEKRAKI